MAVEEGFERVRVLSRGALLAGAAMLLAMVAVHLRLSVTPLSSGFVAAGLLWVGGVYLMVLGALGWAVGWVAQGFLLGRHAGRGLTRDP